MTDDKLEFLENEAEESETEDAQPVEAPEPEAEPVEAEAEEGEKQEEVEPPSATEEESEASDARSVPVMALLDEREKRQLAQQEAKETAQKLKQMEQRLAEFEQKKTQQPPPDFYEDPDKAIQYHNSQQQQQFVGEKLKMSKFLAEREFGAEAVAEAFEYFNQHPQESQALLNEPSPFHAAVEHYKRQSFLKEVSDPDKWREQERERIRQELMAEVQPASKPNAPPPSMVKATAAGKDAIPQGGAFDSMFPD